MRRNCSLQEAKPANGSWLGRERGWREQHDSPDGANGSRERAPDDRLRELRDFRRTGGVPDCAIGRRLAPTRWLHPGYGPPNFGISEITLAVRPKSVVYAHRLVPLEGRIAIVTDAGRDAVDAAALLTNSAQADGEVVWS
jgi:hypothetical protein